MWARARPTRYPRHPLPCKSYQHPTTPLSKLTFSTPLFFHSLATLPHQPSSSGISSQSMLLLLFSPQILTIYPAQDTPNSSINRSQLCLIALLKSSLLQHQMKMSSKPSLLSPQHLHSMVVRVASQAPSQGSAVEVRAPREIAGVSC